MKRAFYDRLAPTYDADIATSDELGVFPFAGYKDVQTIIAAEITDNYPLYPVTVLDLGIGTATLYQRIMPEKIRLTGIDYSRKMLDIAALCVPNATLIEHDLQNGLPESIAQNRYDCIVANYFFHDYSADELIAWIERLTHSLTTFGKIYIGDAMFLNHFAKNECKNHHHDGFDTFPHYHVFEDIVAKIKGKLSLSYLEITHQSGVIVIANYRECSLHNREILVKY